MRIALWAGLILLIGMVEARADNPAPGEKDIWEAAQLDGAWIGFVHTRFEPVTGSGGNRLRSTQELNFTFRRRNALLQSRMEHGTEEAAGGRVLAVFMRQYQGGNQQVTLTGTVEDGRLHYVVDRGRMDRRVRWSEQVIGLHGREVLFRTKKMQPGDTLSYLAFEPTLAAVVSRRLQAIAVEETTTNAGRRKLLRVEETTDKLPGVNVQLPRSVLWLDGDGQCQRRQIEIDGLGTIDLVRASRETAEGRGRAPGVLPDIGLKSLVPLNRAVVQPLLRQQAVYRITVQGEDDAAAAFVQDAHQQARAARGNTFELVVHPLRQPNGTGAARPGPEFLASCYYIDCDDERIKEMSRQVVGAETDPWRAALRIERWVHGNMRPDNEAPLAPASRAARTLRGDCRHYALLTTALCRAEAIPARTAVGLLQIERGGRPYLGFHLWTEVCVDGHWRGLDSTLGQGGVGAGHVKVADHSWHDTRSLTPFLPVQRLLGKMTVRVMD